MDKTRGHEVRTYAEVMWEEAFKKQKEETLRHIAKKKREEEEEEGGKVAEKKKDLEKPKKRNRWN